MSAHNNCQDTTKTMQEIWAKQALTYKGWQSDVTLAINNEGRIASITAESAPRGQTTVDILLPAPVNIHSHAFQRAMAGMAERKAPNRKDSFWGWRTLMYRFLAELNPDDIEAIAAFVQMEMLEAGFAAAVEFHYLHHSPDGSPYRNIAETSARTAAAAEQSGIGLTLLPVFYEQAGCDGSPVETGQRRFKSNLDQFSEILKGCEAALALLPGDTQLGLAPHSLRAASQASLVELTKLLPSHPIHIHIAEQPAEVEEVMAHYGQRPVEWLLANHDIDQRWCLIHATHMTKNETEKCAKSGAIVGLCPITEANLGDGFFDGPRFFKNGGCFGIGSDSNIHISLTQELRTLEYSQRLKHGARAVFANTHNSVGRTLLETTVIAGAQAASRNSGLIDIGQFADVMSLNAQANDLFMKAEDEIIDSFIFCGDSQMVNNVWSAGRHLVRDGKHIRAQEITLRYQQTLQSLKEKM